MTFQKSIRFLVIIAFVAAQIVLLTFVAKESCDSKNWAVLFLIILVSLAVLFGNSFLKLHVKGNNYESLGVAVWVPIGALMCYFLNTHAGLGNVLAAGITGLMASFIPVIKGQSSYLKKLPPAIYCGAFIGMCSITIAPSGIFVLGAGFSAGMVYVLSKNLFVQIGGKLGTIAFVGVLLASLIKWLIL